MDMSKFGKTSSGKEGWEIDRDMSPAEPEKRGINPGYGTTLRLCPYSQAHMRS